MLNKKSNITPPRKKFYTDSLDFLFRDPNFNKAYKETLKNDFVKKFERRTPLYDLIKEGYLENLTQWIDISKETIEKDQQEIATLTSKLEAEKQKYQELIEQQSEKTSGLKEKIDSSFKTIYNLKKERIKYRNDNDLLREHLEWLEKEHAVLITDKESVDSKYQKLKVEIKNSNKSQEEKEQYITYLENFLEEENGGLIDLIEKLKISGKELESKEREE
ncbi:8234_t:CDS:1, partial [Cetraspora pellucida]